MNCRDLIDFLMEYVEGTLPDHQRATFEEHMQICSQCVDYIETYKKTIALTADAWNDDCPEDIPDELIQAILAARKAPPTDG